MMEAGNFKYVLKVTQIQEGEPMNVNTIFRLHTSENIRMSNDLRQQSAVFDARFSRFSSRCIGCKQPSETTLQPGSDKSLQTLSQNSAGLA